MYGVLKYHVSDDEKKLFTADELKMRGETLFDALTGKEGSFKELAEGNVKKAITLMNAMARMRGQNPITSINAYLFSNEMESETPFQMKIQAEIVKNIRMERGMSQQEFSDLCEIKKRSLENWEQGERRLTRCTLEYLISRSISQEEDLYTAVQYHTDDEGISEESIDLLKRLSECAFRDNIDGHDADDYPQVRFCNKNMMYSPEYMIRVDKEQYITDGKVTYKYDLFPEDLRKIMAYAVRNHCDEVYISLKKERSSYLEYMSKLQND